MKNKSDETCIKQNFKFSWKNHNFIDYLDIKKNEVNNLPDGITISTMCGSCKDGLGTDIFLDNIFKYMPLNTNDILKIKKNENCIRTLIPKKKRKRKTKTKTNSDKKKSNNYFFHQITMVIRVFEGECLAEDFVKKEKKINIKIFKNGSIQMSGIKKVEYVNRALNKLIYKLNTVKARLNDDNKIEEIKFVENRENLTLKNFKLDMINTNYKVNMNIDRAKLYDLLLKMKVRASYEKSIRACVIIKFNPKKDNPTGKDISIFVFQAGNIIITGAKSRLNVIDSFNYINNILLEHYDSIIKIEDEDDMLGYLDEVLKENSHKLKELEINDF